MDLHQYRQIITNLSTTGRFYINCEPFCYGLEDPDRDLVSTMSLTEIKRIKIAGNTAIPAGRYRVVKYWSAERNCFLPLLIGVPGFDFVEIHIGNFPKDTRGCLLLGKGIGLNCVTESRAIMEVFYKRFLHAIDNGEEVWITYSYSPPIAA